MVKKRIRREMISWVFVVFIAFILAFLVNSKAYAMVTVNHSSMNNTLFEGQHILVDEISYNFEKPERGDIITFFRYEDKGTVLDDWNRYIENLGNRITKKEETDDMHERLVKRVIGVEGDIIDIKDGAVFINDEMLKEPYAVGKTDSNGLKTPVTVNKDELFVLGDNREVSIDSREIGMINCSQLEGKVIFRIYPFNKIGTIE